MNRQGPIKFTFSTLLMSFTYSLKRVTIRQKISSFLYTKQFCLSFEYTISAYSVCTLISLMETMVYQISFFHETFITFQWSYLFFFVFWLLFHIQPLCKPLVIIQNLFLISSDSTIQRKIYFTLLAWLIQDLNFFIIIQIKFVLK